MVTSNTPKFRRYYRYRYILPTSKQFCPWVGAIKLIVTYAKHVLKEKKQIPQVVKPI